MRHFLPRHSARRKASLLVQVHRLDMHFLGCWIASQAHYVVLFEDNSILQLPERLEASGVKSVWGEVSQESQKNQENYVKIWKL